MLKRLNGLQKIMMIFMILIIVTCYVFLLCINFVEVGFRFSKPSFWRDFETKSTVKTLLLSLIKNLILVFRTLSTDITLHSLLRRLREPVLYLASCLTLR